MLYGGVAALALTYIPLLLKTSHTISQCMCKHGHINHCHCHWTYHLEYWRPGGLYFGYIGCITEWVSWTNVIAFAGWGANGLIVSFFWKMDWMPGLRTILSFLLAMAVSGVIWRNFATSTIGKVDRSFPYGSVFTWYTLHHVYFSCANNDKVYVCMYFLVSPYRDHSCLWLLLLQLLPTWTSSQRFLLQHECYIFEDTKKLLVWNTTISIRRSSISALNLQLSSFYSL